MLYIQSTITIIVFGFLLTACASKNQSTKLSNSAQSVFIEESNVIYKQSYNTWQGTPYKYGGTNKNGIDCSAFVQAIYLESENQYLPRTTYEQSKLGVEIKLGQAQSGDLVFFKTGRKERHVGIYLGDNKFMHASTSKGVIISRLNNPYWASVFWQVRRI
ncbi:NlpC/P60 family protein [Vibrio sp. DW001]|uniref:C40 family peptidase n=1 Tax=Vibrio sp. DW001 TaxID=2912315 RepID=UPI0023AFA199|nr:NlpC/P60 family protein [Vibrio sp. DW001]WED28208.1 NlpC/P60 family protein [Vibrio sp. DW001]